MERENLSVLQEMQINSSTIDGEGGRERQKKIVGKVRQREGL